MSQKIYNLTQHDPTPSQVEAGVEAPLQGCKALLTFDEPGIDVRERAEKLTVLLLREHGLMEGPNRGPQVMIGGLPRLMGPLERALVVAGFRPVYSFSKRVCVETHNPDGSVSLERKFEHVGFDPASYVYDMGCLEAGEVVSADLFWREKLAKMAGLSGDEVAPAPLPQY